MSVKKASSSKTSAKVSSISHHFSYTLIGIFTLVLIFFAAVVIFFDVNKIENELETRSDNAIEFERNSLAIPLWNLDYVVVADFVEA